MDSWHARVQEEWVVWNACIYLCTIRWLPLFLFYYKFDVPVPFSRELLCRLTHTHTYPFQVVGMLVSG